MAARSKYVVPDEFDGLSGMRFTSDPCARCQGTERITITRITDGELRQSSKCLPCRNAYQIKYMHGDV